MIGNRASRADIQRTSDARADTEPSTESRRCSPAARNPARVGPAIAATLLLFATALQCIDLGAESLFRSTEKIDGQQHWLAAPLAPSVGASRQAAGQRILDLTNEARATARYCGTTAFNATRPLRWNDLLADAARLHADDMARYDYFDHRGRDGSKSRDRIKRTGYKSRDSGENIAAGQRNAEEAMAVWIGSEGHCANLMEPAFTEMGAAVAVNSRSEMGRYWVQAFGTPR